MTADPVVALTGVSARYGGVEVLRLPALDVRAREILAVIGPNGSGKSTLLRLLAFLERPAAGEIRFHGRPVDAAHALAERRRIAMVFQQPLLADATVGENVALGLRFRGAPVAESEARVVHWLRRFNIAPLRDQRARGLSGGEAQRVALARALVSSSEVLLLDEPLSNLDAKLREDLRSEIKDLTRKLGITAIYVTHDQLEALAMSDRIAVMLGGRIVQEASPRDLYLKPKTSFVAQFVGQINFFEGAVVDPCPEGLGAFETAHGTWRCAIPGSFTKGARGRLAVRPEGFTLLSSAEAGELNVLDGKVEKATFLGEAIECLVSVGRQIVTAKIPAKREIVEGQQILLRFSPDACLILPPDTN